MSRITCTYCHHRCVLDEGQTGFCHVRRNADGKNISENSGYLTAIALDPIEKKPLVHFYPGSMILSVGSYGCNLRCPFCQNHTISMRTKDQVYTKRMTPEELARQVLAVEGNLGIAFTYNEPFLSFEYIIETAKLIKPYGKKVVMVTNGCFGEDVFHQLEPYVDAMNIDLKGDTSYYRELGGDYEMVMHTIERAAQFCHVEVTTLVVPGKNDRVAFVEEQARRLSEINPEIVYHLSRYFPCYKSEIPATKLGIIYALKEAAEHYLPHVYTGNI